MKERAQAVLPKPDEQATHLRGKLAPLVNTTLTHRYSPVGVAALAVALALVVSGCGLLGGSTEVSVPNSSTSGDPEATGERDLQMVTLLPRDGIPAIDDPRFIPVDTANEQYDDDEVVIGVEFDGDARAYSVPLLSNHEIVNDTVGGVKIAVTW